MNSESGVALALLTHLRKRGVASSSELERALGLSQPTVHRVLRSLDGTVIALGRGRATRYAIAAPLGGRRGTHSIWRFTEQGDLEAWGRLVHLEQGQLYLEHDRLMLGPSERLPWPLAPLRRQGFLGRLAAEMGPIRVLLGTDIESWTGAGHVLASLLLGYDQPGALCVGDPQPDVVTLRAPDELDRRRAFYDAVADDVAHRLPPGSSAGGEQPKFLVSTEASPPEHLLVKFSPPRGTPLGEQWNDLLHAECLALTTLALAGEPVASARIVQSDRRTYLESVRFDRVGASGRRHAVGLDAIHDAFVPEPRQHWGITCALLAKRRRLSEADARRVWLWRTFGRLIGNTDMHFGNLSLWGDDFVRGHFSVAPCYDMLPMAYRPGAHHSDVGPTPMLVPTPLPDERFVRSEAKVLAEQFWSRAAEAQACSAAWRQVCAENAQRVRDSC